MAQHYETEIRRNNLANFLDEHATYGIDEPAKISKALGLDVNTVRNDLRFLKNKYREVNKKYNLEGLATSYRKKHERMEELRLQAKKIGEESENKKDKLEAINLEINIMNNMYHLESDGLNPIVEEMESKHKSKDQDELGN